MKKTQKASITVFATLSFMLVLAVSFSLLEAARITEIQKVTRMNSDAVLEGVFAEYNTPLYQKYGLLGYWADNEKGNVSFDSTISKIQNYTYQNLKNQPYLYNKNALNLLRVSNCDIKVEKYMLMTDDNGRAFTQSIVEKEKRTIPQRLVNELKERLRNIDANKSGDKMDKDLDDAQEAIDNPKEYAKKHNISLEDNYKKEASKNNSTIDVPNDNNTVNKVSDEVSKFPVNQSEAVLNEKTNPLKVINNLRKKGILELVLEKPGEVSNNEIDLKNSLSKRRILSGNIKVTSESMLIDKVALTHYFSEYFSSYTKPRREGALQYEQEYILSGKKDDCSNLKSTINKILVMRTASNMAAIYKDPSKMSQIEALANSLGVVTANPVIMKCAKIGLITAWAYGESILDLRTLMSGGKISIIKSQNEWTLGLSNIGSLTDLKFKAKENKKGIKYEDFLSAFLALKNQKETTINAMDIIEHTIAQQKGYEKFRLDNVIIEAEVDYRYRINTVFLGFVDLNTSKISSVEINNKSRYSYLKNCKE
ncbi:DUF5702 domain-containing protein [Lachnobacterium bovis]|uniref:DUF5702 domain-containing protein n=1 Tax=Lachnobacterium bovis TaxID=140626 RepID=UPI0003B56F43|nr:DUF5702 domain-containing protein [Lachnobacterium bovis]